MPTNVAAIVRDLPPFIRRRDLACSPQLAEMFHAKEPDGAKRVCQHCPVRIRCREWAIATDQIGVWGATTTVERTRIRKQRVERSRAA